jgi:hypothetical protein
MSFFGLLHPSDENNNITNKNNQKVTGRMRYRTECGISAMNGPIEQLLGSFDSSYHLSLNLEKSKLEHLAKLN